MHRARVHARAGRARHRAPAHVPRARRPVQTQAQQGIEDGGLGLRPQPGRLGGAGRDERRGGGCGRRGGQEDGRRDRRGRDDGDALAKQAPEEREDRRGGGRGGGRGEGRGFESSIGHLRTFKRVRPGAGRRVTGRRRRRRRPPSTRRTRTRVPGSIACDASARARMLVTPRRRRLPPRAPSRPEPSRPRAPGQSPPWTHPRGA
mmetsp:Transcript_7200/g.28334  ORF Transcript_7200/g.28334 Transcript_7200/m.28334 type:complete len:204 (-) Transcript_7200:663-1274(-)